MITRTGNKKRHQTLKFELIGFRCPISFQINILRFLDLNRVGSVYMILKIVCRFAWNIWLAASRKNAKVSFNYFIWNRVFNDLEMIKSLIVPNKDCLNLNNPESASQTQPRLLQPCTILFGYPGDLRFGDAWVFRPAKWKTALNLNVFSWHWSYQISPSL